MVEASEIVALQDRFTELWHEQPDAAVEVLLPPRSAESPGEPYSREIWLKAVSHQHRANFDLWHIEDKARAPAATDAELAILKRRIDTINQLRNDLMEVLDRTLLSWLEDRGLPNPAAPLHSETPGMILDRLSILALKIYHTQEETKRIDGPTGHVVRNLERLALLDEQRKDLRGCLAALWIEIERGTRRFKHYRHMKMYNDPSLNPAIYGKTLAQRDL